MAKIAAKWPEKAREIITGSLNTLSLGRYVFIESTAEGRDGYFYELCKGAESIKPLTKLDFCFHFYPWMYHPSYWIDPSGTVIPQEMQEYFESIEAKTGKKINEGQRAWYAKKMESQKEDMKREFPSTSEESWQSSAEGNYYSRYIVEARQGGRITKLYSDPTQPVHTAWDLGYNDSTAIWLFQVDGQRINVLEYYENSGEALPYYLHWLKSKPYNYGKHLVPHYAGQHDYTSGLTRTEVAKNHGVKFTQVPNVPVVDGIDAVRNIPPPLLLR
jgi:hypothetical protein